MIAPDRVIEGVLTTLERSVLPALAPGFARGQLHAVLEVLGALGGQLAWGGVILESQAASLAALAGEAAPLAGGELGARLRDYASGAEGPLDVRVREGRSMVCALIESGLADEGPLAAAVDSWLAGDAMLEAMALRPSRLAEISQG